MRTAQRRLPTAAKRQAKTTARTRGARGAALWPIYRSRADHFAFDDNALF